MILAVFLLLATPAVAGGDPPLRQARVVVLDLQHSADAPAHTRSVVTNALVAEVRKRRGLVVLGISEVRAILAIEESRQPDGKLRTSDALTIVAVATRLAVFV